jgi:DNA-binding MarR family transcriptional regulator
MARPESLARRMRAFNRFYTERIGSLDDRHEGVDLTLAESRTLFTVRALEAPELGHIAGALGLDLGYTSRLVTRLERAGRLRRRPAPADRRRRVVTLTPAGEALFTEVERRSDARMDALTAHLRPAQRTELLAAMDTIRRLLDRPDPDLDHPVRLDPDDPEGTP